MRATPFVLRGLLAFAAVATLLIGGAAATAQEETDVIVLDPAVVVVELTPPLTSVPSGPVANTPAPTGAVDPVGGAGEIPDHASISDPIFGPNPNVVPSSGGYIPAMVFDPDRPITESIPLENRPLRPFMIRGGLTPR